MVPPRVLFLTTIVLEMFLVEEWLQVESEEVNWGKWRRANGVDGRGYTCTVGSCMLGNSDWLGFENAGINFCESPVFYLAFPHQRGLDLDLTVK